MTNQIPSQTPSVELLPLSRLRESPHNPRRQFDAARLTELAENIAKVGILQPLLVRPVGEHYEILAGHRRFRAAGRASLRAVPCLVRELSDLDALEVMMIDNLQRHDLHPLDEAQGYCALMAPPHRQTSQTIAAKFGKSERYVYDRVKLLDLIPALQDCFWAHDLTLGHAIILARIPADRQQLCLEQGLFITEHTLYDPVDTGHDDQPPPRKAISVRELQAWVDRHVRFDQQPDPMLYPETAKTLEAADQADEKVLPITYEASITDAVRDGSRIFGPRAWTRADGQHGTKTCQHSELGLVVTGVRRGEAFRVCRAKQTCLVHYGKEIRDRKKAEAALSSGDSGARQTIVDRQRKREEAEAAERAREEQIRETWQQAAPAILKAVAARVTVMPTHAKGHLAQLVVQELSDRGWIRKTPPLVPVGKTVEDVLRHCAFLILEREVDSYAGHRDFPERATALGVDLDRILAPDQPEQNPARQKSQKKRT